MRNTTCLAMLTFLAACSSAAGEDPSTTADPVTGVVPPIIGPGGLTAAANPTVDASFVVTGLARKCVDFGGEAYQAVGSPVFLYGCNGTVAQKVRVVELTDGTHDVSLRAGDRFCFGVRGGAVVAGAPIELQACDATSPAQRFALDGDAIYVGTQASGRVTRDLVVEVDRGRGANRTPLVVGARDVDDAEDFRFGATSFAALFPTSGFTMILSRGDLDRALAAASWGSVIQVAPGTDITIDDTNERMLGEGVTLRGDRKGTDAGQQILRSSAAAGTFLSIAGNDARITGLRLRGPDTTTDDDAPLVKGVHAPNDFRVTIDHVEMSAWTGAAVEADGDFADADYCGAAPPQNIRVLKSYLHDNARQDFGYGVVSSHGANPIVDGDVFDHNRHAVSADSNGRTGYTATYNLVFSGNEYCSVWPICWKEQDFDVHGSDPGSGHQGGQAAGLVVMEYNSFYSPGKSIDVRGTPCESVTIESNVFVSDEGTAIKNANTIPDRQTITGNDYSATVGTMAVGDFDGDGVQDDFIGTGVAWYYRPGRANEWRFLNRAAERAEQLTFGDFDGDGRTDVRKIDLPWIDTSWGGSSPWDRTRVRRPPVGRGAAR